MIYMIYNIYIDMVRLEQVLRNAVISGQPRSGRPWDKIVICVEGIYRYKSPGYGGGERGMGMGYEVRVRGTSVLESGVRGY